MSHPESGARLLGIGEFALRTRLPISTLRYYARIGLLEPAFIDPLSGYRRYRPEQLDAALRVAELRELGVVPADIAAILGGGAAAEATLAAVRRGARRDIAHGHRRLRYVELVLAADERDQRHRAHWVLRPQHTVAVLPYEAQIAQLTSEVTRQIVRLRGNLRRARVERDGPWGAQFPALLTDRVNGFVCAAVEEPADGVDTHVVPAGPAVQVDHDGGLASLPRAYQAGYAALDDAGARPGAVVLEHYLDAKGATPGPRVRLWIPYTR